MRLTDGEDADADDGEPGRGAGARVGVSEAEVGAEVDEAAEVDGGADEEEGPAAEAVGEEDSVDEDGDDLDTAVQRGEEEDLLRVEAHGLQNCWGVVGDRVAAFFPSSALRSCNTKYMGFGPENIERTEALTAHNEQGLDDNDEYQALSDGLICLAKLEKDFEGLHSAFNFLVGIHFGDQLFIFFHEIWMIFRNTAELQ